MKLKSLFAAAALAAGSIAASLSASAATFGYYLSGTSGSPAGAITAAGHTAVQLNNLTAGDLAGIDVLWILNGINGEPDANVMNNTAAVANFVSAGGVLSFHDRNVNQGTSAGRYIPGAASTTFVNNFSSSIDVVTINTVTNGPAGVIGNTTLDGGSLSNHGYAEVATLPTGAVVVLNDGDATHAVDFHYDFGLGDVYYSSIPLDYYFGGANPAAFRDIYAVNEAAFQAQLRGNVVPVPATLLLVGLGLGLIGVARRKL